MTNITPMNLTWLYSNPNIEQITCAYNDVYSGLVIFFILLIILIIMTIAGTVRTNNFVSVFFVSSSIITASATFLFFFKYDGCNSLLLQDQFIVFIALWCISGLLMFYDKNR